MMDKHTLVQYALLGMKSEIKGIEDNIRKAKNFIADIENGKEVSTKLNKNQLCEKLDKWTSELAEKNKQYDEFFDGLDWTFDIEIKVINE